MIDESVKVIDPLILLSIINTKLRDQYSSLDSLCEDLNLTKDEIIEKLKTVGYEYSTEENRFK